MKNEGHIDSSNLDEIRTGKHRKKEERLPDILEDKYKYRDWNFLLHGTIHGQKRVTRVLYYPVR